MPTSTPDVVLEIDGASRGNPGPSAWGARLAAHSGETIMLVGGFLGEATNNVAEWRALIGALIRARRLEVRKVTVRSDSELLVRQATGRYRVRNKRLVPLARRAFDLIRTFDDVRFLHVARDENKTADKLANRTLDARAGGPPDPEDGVVLQE